MQKNNADPKLKEWLPMCNVHALFLPFNTLNRTTENLKKKRNENKIKSNLRKCKQKPKLSRNVLQLHSCCNDDFLYAACIGETGNKRLRDDQSNFSLAFRLRNTF